MTETWKPKKLQLVKDGYDPDNCQGEALYYLDIKANTFTVLDKETFETINNGEIRLWSTKNNSHIFAYVVFIADMIQYFEKWNVNLNL